MKYRRRGRLPARQLDYQSLKKNEINAVFISFLESFWKILILQGGVNSVEFAH